MGQAVILETISGITYYDYNGILCAFAIHEGHISENRLIMEPLNKFEQSLIVERFHRPENKVAPEDLYLLRNKHFKLFEKYEH